MRAFPTDLLEYTKSRMFWSGIDPTASRGDRWGQALGCSQSVSTSAGRACTAKANSIPVPGWASQKRTLAPIFAARGQDVAQAAASAVARLWGRQAHPVVLDRENDLIVELPGADRDAAGFGVFDDVGKNLLQTAKQVQHAARNSFSRTDTVCDNVSLSRCTVRAQAVARSTSTHPTVKIRAAPPADIQRRSPSSGKFSCTTRKSRTPVASVNSAPSSASAANAVNAPARRRT